MVIRHLLILLSAAWVLFGVGMSAAQDVSIQALVDRTTIRENESFTYTIRAEGSVRGEPGTASFGLVQAGALEGSNVDLTQELVNMITAQRNFQANAQMISTADTVTQTIINIR